MVFSAFESFVIYFITFALSALFAGLYARQRNSIKYIFFILALSIPALLPALRGITVGVDYHSYFYHIQQFTRNIHAISDFSLLDSNFEFGFNLLIYIISRLTSDVQVIVFFINVFMLFFILKGLVKLLSSKYVALGYFFYLSTFFFFSFNGLRQAMAIAIVFFSISYIRDKRLFAYISIIVLAMQFHITAVVAMVMYFLYSTKNIKYEFRYLVISLIGLLFIALFLERTSALMGMEYYITSKYAQSTEAGKLTATIKIFQAAILVFPFFLWKRKLKNIDPFNRLYYNLLIIYVFTQILVLQVTQALRLSFYFELAIIPLAIQIIEQTKKKLSYNNIIFLIYILSYMIIYKFIYINVWTETGAVSPYILSLDY